MASIYNIGQDLLELFQVMEDNGGEITEEQEKYLTIKEDELNSKLEQYAKAIREFEQYIVNCKEEEKRIKYRRNVYSNRIERLKNTMIEALKTFGKDSKSGAKFIELPTMRINTRSSKSVEIDEARSQKLLDTSLNYIEELIDNDLFNTADFDEESFMAVINQIIKSEYEESPFMQHKTFRPYTVDDFNNIRCEINFKANISDLIKSHPYIIQSLLSHSKDIKCDCVQDNSKTELKDIINDGKEITFAELNTNTYLQIK